jgi:cytochrome c-type biogenesis protein
MTSLFDWLTRSLENTPLIAVTASFFWGILSILLSPCHLSSIPLIVGYINDRGEITTRRAFSLAGIFSTGILLTIASIGVITSLIGRMLGDIGKVGNYFVAVIFFIFGFYLLGLLPLPFVNGTVQPGVKKKGFLSAFIIGLFFGLAVGPCTFAYMAPMLGITFQMASTRPVFAASLILFYAMGHCSIIMMAGTFTNLIQKYLNWNEKSKGAVILKKICGFLVILGGVYLIWSAY